MPRRYYIVDVFAARKYAGNQLAVVVDAEGLSTAEMQSIAREMNFSETTFLGSKEPRDGGFDVRIFTPTEEMPFAGHPTLGTGYVLRREIAALATAAEVRLNLGVGQVPVTFSSTATGDVAWMSPPTPKLGKTQSPEVAAALLRISPGDVDTRYPAQEASVGISFLLVPLRSRKALAAMQLDPERRAELQRPGESLRAQARQDELSVHVGGGVVMVARGELI
jgi:trans-2,3-dihydro-3-hydroxyanthranilate isomerase